jgi:hypothetical protein
MFFNCFLVALAGTSDFCRAAHSFKSTIALTSTFLSTNLSASEAVSATVASASPTPLDFNCSALTPLASKAFTTDAALSLESFKLYASEPFLSV